jgi:hypothetical protein
MVIFVGNIGGFGLQSIVGQTGQVAQTPDAVQLEQVIGTCPLNEDVAVTYSIVDSFKKGVSLNADYNLVVW